MGSKVVTANFYFRETLPAAAGYPKSELLLKAAISDEGLRNLSLVCETKKLPPDENVDALRDPKKALSRYKKLREIFPRVLRAKSSSMNWKDFDMRGRGDFHARVWKAIHAIPTGHTASYAEVAGDAGSPMAFRACGQACGANPIMFLIPCHRVVGASGLGGFGCDLDLKKHLLALEDIDWKSL
jgi:O-6-methylguanine DNA methyltransferase